MKEIGQIIAVVGSLIGGSLGPPALADDGDRVVRIDHYVGVRSTVPAISGQMTSIYVREVVRVGTALRDGATGSSCSSMATARREKWRSTCRTGITAGWSSWPARGSTYLPWI